MALNWASALMRASVQIRARLPMPRRHHADGGALAGAEQNRGGQAQGAEELQSCGFFLSSFGGGFRRQFLQIGPQAVVDEHALGQRLGAHGMGAVAGRQHRMFADRRARRREWSRDNR